MEPIKELYEEVRCDYNDGEGYQHIDAWEHGKEDGATVAVVNDKTGDVYYLQPEARLYSPMVKKAVDNVVAQIKKSRHKVWVVTRNEVSDFEEFEYEPKVFCDRESARKYLAELRKNGIEEYIGEGKDKDDSYAICADSKDRFQLYDKEQGWSHTHYEISIFECGTDRYVPSDTATPSSARRIFSIGETVFYEDDHERGWGKVILVNGEASYPQYICSYNAGDIITIQKEGCTSEIETTPDRVYQLAPGRSFWGNPVVWEHHEDIDYPFYCPARDENCYHFEVENTVEPEDNP